VSQVLDIYHAFFALLECIFRTVQIRISLFLEVPTYQLSEDFLFMPYYFVGLVKSHGSRSMAANYVH